MKTRVFELFNELEAGHSARARLLKWDGRQYVPSNEEIVLHDVIGRHGIVHDRGYAALSEESHQWEVIGGLCAHEGRDLL